MGAFNLETCARPNILQLEPYRCARDDYKDDGTNVLLDANENAYGPGLHLTPAGDLPTSADTHNHTNGSNDTSDANPTIDFLGLNRYPDPHQTELKQLFCDLRNSGAHSSTPLTPANLFVGVGSDEAIDAILRTFCMPGKSKLLTCPPTYGMYGVSACVNDVEVVRVPLEVSTEHAHTSAEAFALRPDAVCEALAADPNIKAAYVCSPGNPTGQLVSKDAVRRLLEHPTWNGVVVVDEAYVDFADDPATASLATWVPEWPNLIVMQTLSKGFGLAGVRIGVAIADPKIARVLNSLKAPYNISSPSSALGVYALKSQSLSVMNELRDKIISQRVRLIRELPGIEGVGRIRGGKDANFILVEMLDVVSGQPSNEVALAVYERMAERKNVVVRFRGKEHGCLGCLRITVGTDKEVSKFLGDLKAVLQEIAQSSRQGEIRSATDARELKEEQRANDILA